MSESYGSQAEGIDLVNGSLDEQIAKLKELNIAQSERFLNENQKGIEEAQRQMEKQRHTYLGQIFPFAQDADKLQSIVDKYKDKGIYTDTDSNGTIYVHFKGDATQANEVLNDFMTDIRNASDETGNIDLFDGFAQNASAGLNEAGDILDEYQNLYNQAMEADIQTNKKDYYLYLYTNSDTKYPRNNSTKYLLCHFCSQQCNILYQPDSWQLPSCQK